PAVHPGRGVTDGRKPRTRARKPGTTRTGRPSARVNVVMARGRRVVPGPLSGGDSIVALRGCPATAAGRLEVVEEGVLSAGLQELGVGAPFTHAAGFQVEDQVGPAGQQQVVSDQECGPSLGQPLQRLDHRTFVFPVQACRGLVEDEDRGVYCRMARSWISTRPAVGSYSRRMRLANVDFPLPDGPTSATRCPGCSTQSICSSAGRPGS